MIILSSSLYNPHSNQYYRYLSCFLYRLYDHNIHILSDHRIHKTSYILYIRTGLYVCCYYKVYFERYIKEYYFLFLMNIRHATDMDSFKQIVKIEVARLISQNIDYRFTIEVYDGKHSLVITDATYDKLVLICPSWYPRYDEVGGELQRILNASHDADNEYRASLNDPISDPDPINQTERYQLILSVNGALGFIKKPTTEIINRIASYTVPNGWAVEDVSWLENNKIGITLRKEGSISLALLIAGIVAVLFIAFAYIVYRWSIVKVTESGQAVVETREQTINDVINNTELTDDQKHSYLDWLKDNPPAYPDIPSNTPSTDPLGSVANNLGLVLGAVALVVILSKK